MHDPAGNPVERSWRVPGFSLTFPPSPFPFTVPQSVLDFRMGVPVHLLGITG